MARSLETTIASSFDHVDPRDPPQPEPSEFPWPDDWSYDGDYWKDELGYYRQTDG